MKKQKKQSYTLCLDNQEWSMLRQASMRGKLHDAVFYREAANGNVTFTTDNPKSLCKQLDEIFPWACSAAEIFNLDFVGA